MEHSFLSPVSDRLLYFNFTQTNLVPNTVAIFSAERNFHVNGSLTAFHLASFLGRALLFCCYYSPTYKQQRTVPRTNSGDSRRYLIFNLLMDQLNAALVSIKVLRSSVGQVFESLGSGIRAEHGDEGRETKFLLELQERLNAVNVNLR